MVCFKAYLQIFQISPSQFLKSKKKKEYTVVTDKMFRANLKTNLKASTYDKEKNGHKKVSCIANLSLQFRHQTGILSQFILLNTVF